MEVEGSALSRVGWWLMGGLCLPLPHVSSRQVLTIAATEPTSLLHSKPPKPTQARERQLLLSAPGGREDSGPETPGPDPKTNGPAPEASGPAAETNDPAPEAPSESLADPSAEGDFSVDFEKIYKYLSSVSRSCQGPELSAAGEDDGQGLSGRESQVASPALLSLFSSPSVTRGSRGP